MSLKHQVRAIMVIAWLNGLLPILRSPLWSISMLTTPLSLFVLLTILFRSVGMLLGVVGGLVWTVLSSSIMIIGDAAYYRLQLRFQHMIVATPTSPLAYALGLALSELVFSLPGLVIFSVLLIQVGHPRPFYIPAVVLSLFMLWYSMSGVAFYFSTIFKHVRYTWAVTGILNLVLGVLPPIYYPATYLGRFYWLAYLVPTSDSAMVLQYSVGLVHYASIQLLISYTSGLLWCLIGTVLTLRVARWRSP
ncbi:ABC transporter [Vulcanisaeta thermophila]|uniref:ABC transporter n=1 Tax=Vulcanisaeta thermophila TaxID=867917 RepID=UPI000AF00255|nr:ABC transporter [Vulcanisaeta thermophila]